MYVKERIKNHFLNLIGDKELAALYFYNRDIVDEFNKNNFTKLEKNVKKFERKYDIYFNIYNLVNYMGVDSLVEKVTKNLAKTDKLYRKSMNEFDVFKSNLAYLIVSGILKLENVLVMGYTEEFIKEFLLPYQYQADNPYNKYYYNENNGRTSMIDEKGRGVILPYTPHSVLEKINEKESQLDTNIGVSSLKR
ncbi:MAG: hypothetical protein J6B98_07300 [Bacilli bacterium]|nr:hypothetical protein [Bacilli bacterium]